MRRISSKATFYYKRIFPAIWFGFLLIIITIQLIAPAIGGSAFGTSIPAVIVPLIMIFVGYSIMKKLVFDLVDEVWEDGDALVVRNGKLEDRVALADIMNVNYVPIMRPPKVTLSLRKPSRFGDQVSFCAPVTFMPFARSPVVDELIRRVDAKRRAT